MLASLKMRQQMKNQYSGNVSFPRLNFNSILKFSKSMWLNYWKQWDGSLRTTEHKCQWWLHCAHLWFYLRNRCYRHHDWSQDINAWANLNYRLNLAELRSNMRIKHHPFCKLTQTTKWTKAVFTRKRFTPHRTTEPYWTLAHGTVLALIICNSNLPLITKTVRYEHHQMLWQWSS